MVVFTFASCYLFLLALTVLFHLFFLTYFWIIYFISTTAMYQRLGGLPKAQSYIFFLYML